MQISANTPADKKAVMERSVQSNERTAVQSPKTQTAKAEEIILAKGAERNETSQYLKVLSRIENLLIQNKLPDAAVEGFIGAIKKQLEAINEADKKMLMNLPELKKLDVKKLEDLPNLIKSDFRNKEKSADLFKLLRQPEFAVLMRTDNKPAPKTYSAQPVQPLSAAKLPVMKAEQGPAGKGIEVLTVPSITVGKTPENNSSPRKNLVT
ncbi:MAG: hypothetical protein H8E38_06830 [SAR324 cluster bacterium]|nr:hypothetical protein [SAR324 cluster bacterium]MBL7035376.1 hypothetical protein [SAR324 cluster bacterium]